MLINWLLGINFCKLLLFFNLNINFAGFGLLVKTETIPAGNDSIISPISLTCVRDSSLPLKYEWIISWKATAIGIVSAKPIVKGDGPLEEPRPAAVRNSKLATLSARDIVAGDILPLVVIASPLRDGGLGIAIDPVELADCFGGNAGVRSPSSENKSESNKKMEIRFILKIKYLKKIYIY